MRTTCPYCTGDGCCYCDHLGYLFEDEGTLFKKVRRKIVIIRQELETKPLKGSDYTPMKKRAGNTEATIQRGEPLTCKADVGVKTQQYPTRTR